jgi:hypothetical protein
MSDFVFKSIWSSSGSPYYGAIYYLMDDIGNWCNTFPNISTNKCRFSCSDIKDLLM